MNNLSLKIKKIVIKKFLKDLNKKIKSFYFDIETISFLSKRKIYKLLKIAYEVEGKKINKIELKKYSKILSKITKKKLSKKEINFLYTKIMKKNILKYIDKITKDFIDLIEIFLNKIIDPFKTFKYIYKKMFLHFNILII